MSQLHDSLLELIRRTSAEIPDDVNQAIVASLEQEKKGLQRAQRVARDDAAGAEAGGQLLFGAEEVAGFELLGE